MDTICVAGGGTMGSGIAMNAAQNNFNVILFDINPEVLTTAKDQISKNFRQLADKGKLSQEDQNRLTNNIKYTSDLNQCKADLVIEAIIEKLEAKQDVFSKLASVNTGSTIFASNTSSLSITDIQRSSSYADRVVGMHYFNPAHIMKLVEVIRGEQTSEETVKQVMDLCKKLGKTAVLCKDSPGFIVNRVARHYYLEAMNLVEKKVATIEEVDAVMESLGFKMGPFRLMDLIGLDINLAVSESIYDAFDKAPRFQPSSIQRDKVSRKELGRKSGKGFYNYNA